MAAFDTPLLTNLGPPMTSHDQADLGSSPPDQSYYASLATGAPPTYASFSPVTLSAKTPSRSSRRSTILVHQKSPLLLATPPQITRALAYSHPFILPLNTFAGLLTWSSGDPWKSFLLLCAFWAVVLYGDVLLLWAGPLVVGIGLIIGMYGRRYSPLSSSGWGDGARDVAARNAASSSSLGGAAMPSSSSASSVTAVEGNSSQTPTTGDPQKSKHTRVNSEVTSTRHQKTLDEIVETLKELTGRCNVLVEPLLEMTDFLSTQRTATSATTRPALTAMFMRLVIVTPFWIALTAPPWRILTARRVVLVAGTLVLTWHARVMRVTRTILWRSATVRRLASATTGLQFDRPARDINSGKAAGSSKPPGQAMNKGADTTAAGSGRTAGVKFTFIIYENQRRWVGLGWTNSLFSYERPAWADDHNNAVPPKDEFELPSVEDGSNMKWRWVGGSRWRVDGVSDENGAVDYDSEEGKNGWIYYDNKWQYGRRGVDGWGRWTRRRKWYRDAELVEVDGESSSSADTKGFTPTQSEPAPPRVDESSAVADDSASMHSTSTSSRRSWGVFRPAGSTVRKRPVGDRASTTSDTQRPRRDSEVPSIEEEHDLLGRSDIELETELEKRSKDGQWGIGDEARMNLE